MLEHLELLRAREWPNRALAFSRQTDGRDAPRLLLLESHADTVSATLPLEHDLFSGGTSVRADDDIEIASRARLGSSGDGKSTDESALNAQVCELANDALERMFD